MYISIVLSIFDQFIIFYLNIANLDKAMVWVMVCLPCVWLCMKIGWFGLATSSQDDLTMVVSDLAIRRSIQTSNDIRRILIKEGGNIENDGVYIREGMYT